MVSAIVTVVPGSSVTVWYGSRWHVGVAGATVGDRVLVTYAKGEAPLVTQPGHEAEVWGWDWPLLVDVFPVA